MWHSRDNDVQGLESVGRLLSWDKDIHGASGVELESLCQALDSVGVVFDGIDMFWTESADEADFQDRPLSLGRCGYSARSFAGFQERYRIAPENPQKVFRSGTVPYKSLSGRL